MIAPVALLLACLQGPAIEQQSLPPFVFVERQIPDQGTLYWPVPRDLPGVGTRSRFRVAAPGKLMMMSPPAPPTVLIDGSSPTPASLELIDVNAPAVSYDGTWIAFAGLPAGVYPNDPANNPGAWRIYVIRRDGTGLRQVTFSDQALDLSQFGPAAWQLQPYDDTDPAFLPDGRIVFASTRWPSLSSYGKHFPGGIRTTNLFVVDADGSNLHRITSGHHSAERPLVDPLTGKIVFFRWWFNFRTATQRLSTIPDPNGGFVMHDGLTTSRAFEIHAPKFISENSWHAASVNPDGTQLHMWSGGRRDLETSHAYGGSFTPQGELVANFYPMFNMTEASGFGGIRRHPRGPGAFVPIAGITDLSGTLVLPYTFRLYVGEYFAEPEVLPDGRILVSRAPDYFQDYGLYLIDSDGSNRRLVYDNAGTTEVRARLLIARPLPPIIPDQITQVASALPPVEGGNYFQDGTFAFDALNVYFNAPVDVDVVSAPPVGSGDTLRFFLDMQRVAQGGQTNLDWPVLLREMPIAPDGSVRNSSAPADLPLFEQMRDPEGLVPLTGGPEPIGAAHVTGMNFGRPGAVASCVGCHAGHTMIPVPAAADAQWTNLAPGARVAVSSTWVPGRESHLIDRRAGEGPMWQAWTSTPGQSQGQWVELDFPVPITVRSVRLYDPRKNGDRQSTLHVSQSTVRLFADHGGSVQVASAQSGPLATTGTDVPFPDVLARMLRVELDSVSGTWYGSPAAGLAEIEVIARGEQGP